MTRLFLGLCLALWVLAAPAALADRYAIIGATVFDGTGAPPVIATVVVKDGVIESVTPGTKVPSGVKRVAAKGLALLPGFFDVHTHYTPNGQPATAPQISAAYVAAGVTTVNDFHEPPEAYAPRRAWYESFPGPHVRFAARMSTPGGHGADWADINTTRWANTPAAATAAVEAVIPYKPDFIKAFTDGWRYGSGIDNTSMDLPTLTALVEAAHAHKLKVGTHTVTLERGKIAARAGVDIIVHSLQDLPVDDELIDLMRKSGTAYAATLAVYEPVKPGQTTPADTPAFRQRIAKFDIALSNVKKLHAAGVLLALGTDAGMPGTPHGTSTLREMELLVKAGLTPTEALIAGTSGSAKALGLDDRGRIAPGLKADFVLVRGRPWENISDIRNTDRTFVDGKIMFGPGAPKPETRTTEKPATLAAALVIDFERPDGRTTAGALPVTDGDGGVDRSVQLSVVETAETGGRYLSITSRMAQRKDANTQYVVPLSVGSVQPVDVRSFAGVKFRVRGDGDYALAVSASGDPWSAPFKATPTWSEVSVPFSALKPAESGAEWAGDDLTDLRFTLSRPGGSTTWLELDDVSFY